MRYKVAMTCPVHGAIAYSLCLGIHQCPLCKTTIVSGLAREDAPGEARTHDKGI